MRQLGKVSWEFNFLVSRLHGRYPPPYRSGHSWKHHETPGIFRSSQKAIDFSEILVFLLVNSWKFDIMHYHLKRQPESH